MRGARLSGKADTEAKDILISKQARCKTLGLWLVTLDFMMLNQHARYVNAR